MTKEDKDLKQTKEENDMMSYKLALIITAFLAWILIKLLLYYI